MIQLSYASFLFLLYCDLKKFPLLLIPLNTNITSVRRPANFITSVTGGIRIHRHLRKNIITLLDLIPG